MKTWDVGFDVVLHVGGTESQTKDATELHYKKCRIKHFWPISTHSRN